MDAFPDGQCAGVALQYAVEPEPLDTAGAIPLRRRLAGIDETFVVVNGDVLTDLDVTSCATSTAHRGAEGTIALTPVDDPLARRRRPSTTRPGAPLRREARPADRPDELINAGTYVLEPSVIERIPGGRKVSIERETFPDGRRRHAVRHASDGYWLDAGKPEHLRRGAARYSSTGCGAPPSRPCTRVPTSTPPPSSTTRS